MIIYVDGSGIGFGLCHQDKNFFFETEGVTVNTNEVNSVIMGIKYAIHHRQNAVIYNDSKTAITVVNKGSSPVPHLDHKGKLAQQLLKKAREQFKLAIEIIWIPGSTNKADAASRRKGNYEEGWSQSFIIV